MHHSSLSHTTYVETNKVNISLINLRAFITLFLKEKQKDDALTGIFQCTRECSQ